MGSGASATVPEMPGGDLRLPASGLKFSVNQLRALNSYVDALWEEDQKGRISTELESTLESVVQRIVDGAGQKDPRFRCSHLIALHRGKKMKSRSLEYLVTLDALPVLNSSEECRLVEGATGYGKIRLTGRDADRWEEFLSPSGYLCSRLSAIQKLMMRHLAMKSRSLEYLVTLDALPVLNSSEECRLVEGATGYGKIRLTGRDADRWEEFLSPSGYLCRDKVVERWVEVVARCGGARGAGGAARALTAQAHAQAQPYNYCYLEKVSTTSHPPTPIDRRLAIVEGSAWVMVRLGTAEAKLVLGARVHGIPPNALRLPAIHPLAMLHYTAAQQGYYAVAIGPPSSMVCGERGSSWQLWSPAVEETLDGHLSDVAAAAKLAGAVNALIDHMREGAYQGSLLAVSRYLAWCCYRRRLLRCWQLPTAAARAFVSSHASHHLLLVLDELYSICANNTPAGYWLSVGRQSVCRRAARAPRWEGDANCLRQCLLQLQRTTGEEIPPTPAENLEIALFTRWENLNKEIASSGATYTRRQLRYLHMLFNKLIAQHNLIHTDTLSTFHANLLQATSFHQQSVEDLIHVLAIILDQARDLYVNNHHWRQGLVDEELSAYRNKKWVKLKEYYDASSACLIDCVRRDCDLRTADLTDPATTIKTILKWLYKGAKEDKKYLGPVLKPYLDGLFMSSLENCWFYENENGDCELEGLKDYCLKVHDGLEASTGLIEAAKKYAWAKVLLDFVDRYKHVEFRLIFPTGEGMGLAVGVRCPRGTARTLPLSRADKHQAKLRLAKRALCTAFAHTLAHHSGQKPKPIPRHESEEILASVKSGHYWRSSTKPDIIPSTTDLDAPRVRRRSRRSRPNTSHGFPEISITSQSDTKTLRRKYHTLKSLVYTEPVDVKEIRQRPRSAGSSMRNKEAMSRPSILETMDFINSVKDALCVEESGASDVEESPWSVEDEWCVGVASPINVAVTRKAPAALHLVPHDLVPALLVRGCFTILQEVSVWLGSGREGALFALHRLAKDARSRSSERKTSSWKLPESSPPQQYKSRPPDYMSGDEAPPPPPLPRSSSTRISVLPRYKDYNPPARINTNTNNNFSSPPISPYDPPPTYTGIINPIYDIKLPRDKFQVKRSKSLGRSFSTKSLGVDLKYNITLGKNSGRRTNDVVTAISGMTGETGVETKSNFFQRRTTADVVGDSYRLSRITID